MLPKVKNSSPTAVRTFDVIVFDLDGVVVDSGNDLVSAIQYSLKQVGSQDPGFTFIHDLIGIGSRQLILRSLEAEKKARVDDAMIIFREYYEQNCTNQTVLYPGVQEMLAFYHADKYLALATFKIRKPTLKLLTALDVRQYFDVIVTADDVVRPKPDPEAIITILSALHCHADTALLVGDTPTDVQTGRNAGISTCAVTYGMGTKENLRNAQPDFLIDDIRELKNIVVG